jgi:hypothetical protein
MRVHDYRTREGPCYDLEVFEEDITALDMRV